MPKVSTNINLDVDLKRACQELYADLGMDLTTAVTIFLKQSLRVQGLPFAVTRDIAPAETISRPEASDEEVLSVSRKLINQNRAAYEVLAK